MAEEWTTTELLTAIRAKGRLAADDPDATNSALLSLADDQMKTRFVPAIRAARADWYSAFEDTALVAGQDAYRIPHRAASSSVRTVLWYDSSGRRFECYPVSMSDQHAYSTRSGRPQWYAIEDDRVRLIPKPASALGTLRIYYERRPATLIETSGALQVAGELSDATTLVVSAGAVNPSGILAEGDLADLVKKDPPFSACFIGREITDISLVFGAYLIFFEYDSATMQLPTSDSVATDWLCPAGESPIPQIPPELHPLLALVTAAEYLQPIDPEAYDTLMGDFSARFEQAIKLLSPRQQGRQQKMRGGSTLRRGVRRGGTFDDFTG